MNPDDPGTMARRHLMADDEWDEALATDSEGTAGAEPDDDTPDQPEPLYPSVEAWVEQWLAPSLRRPWTKDLCWCPEWWRHTEVISRLEALWRSWEHLRTDGTTGMSVWWRDHADPHLASLLTRETSPMSGCGRHGGHTEYEPLETTPAPPGWWGTDE